VAALNARVTRHLGASRKALFEELERSAPPVLPQLTMLPKARAGLPRG
jgi:hypothetical protein